MKQRLSSHVTLAQKVVIPALLTAIFPFGVVMAFLHEHYGTCLYLVCLIILMQFFFAAIAYPLKHVYMDDEGLLINNYKTTIVVPYSQVEAVKTIWFYPSYVEIKLKEPCAFGRAVLFIPKLTMAIPFLRSWSAEAAILAKCASEEARKLSSTSDT